jgi:hypothetical protein
VRASKRISVPIVVIVACGCACAVGVGPAAAAPGGASASLHSRLTVDPAVAGPREVTYHLEVGDLDGVDRKASIEVSAEASLQYEGVIRHSDHLVVAGDPSPTSVMLTLFDVGPRPADWSIDLHFRVLDTSREAAVSAGLVSPVHTSTTASTADAPIAITSAAPPMAHLGAPYSFVVTGSRYTPTAFHATGLEAAGLSIDPASGAITGTPAAGGMFPVSVDARAADGTSAHAEYVLHITGMPPALTGGGAPAATVGTPYSFTIMAAPGAAAQYAVTGGRLPNGLALDRASGCLSGTPTVPGAFTFHVTAANDAGSATAFYSIDVAPAAPAEG